MAIIPKLIGRDPVKIAYRCEDCACNLLYGGVMNLTDPPSYHCVCPKCRHTISVFPEPEGKRVFDGRQSIGISIKANGKEQTLEARVYYDDVDATMFIRSERLNWRRESGNKYEDELWNTEHRGMKSITVGVDDVNPSAAFFVELLSEDEVGPPF